MNVDQKLLIGIDLTKESSQISYYNQKTFEATTIYEIPSSKQSKIPTVLALTKDGREWLIGQGALEAYDKGEASLITDLLCTNETARTICGVEITNSQLLSKFIRKLLLLVKREFPNDVILRCVVTVERLDKETRTLIYEAFELLGVNRDRLHVVSHQKSFYYFALSQKKELWMNDVALFDFTKEGLTYYQLNVDRRTSPMLAGIQKKELQTMFNKAQLALPQDEREYLFDNVTMSAMHKQIISTVYLTGEGFEGTWMTPCLQRLCVGRRVFVGQSLYCFGAAYAAKEEAIPNKLEDIVYLGEECIPFSVSMILYTNGRNKELLLVETATPWYEVNHTFHVIIDGENELQIIIKDAIKKTTQTRILPLDGLETRMNKGTRLEIRLSCTNTSNLVVSLKDLGFGSLVPSTNRIWESIITV